MPLGIFSSINNGPKPQPLTSQKNKKEKSSTLNAGFDIKDSKGSIIKLGKKTYTVEKKLAEGGFALVYLVCDKYNRNYALKRQLIRDDPRQVEACKTECQIVVKILNHKNIVSYVDHQLSLNKCGVYDYMLLTRYYPTNVLQLMNSRLLNNQWLTTQEIFNIFCDVCEAVARLHHSKTPVIHRDLKVENVLIDQRMNNEKPVYKLCDFGSATTKVLSKETHSQEFVEEEIKRYTTLSYRAPEMIDLYSGIPITTKSDVWALGVLLYKICYFALPFGESALAIQNGIFSFPVNPSIPDEIKAIINLLLTLNPKHRPNIFQTSYLVFSAANRECSVLNIESSPQIELPEALEIFRLCKKFEINYSLLLKNFTNLENIKNLHNINFMNLFQSSSKMLNTINSNQTKEQQENLKINFPTEGVIVNTTNVESQSFTTSINPRLRPKAVNTSNILLAKFNTPLKQNFNEKIFKSLSSIASPTSTKNTDAFALKSYKKYETIKKSQFSIDNTKFDENKLKKNFDFPNKQKNFKLQNISKTSELLNNCETTKTLTFSSNSKAIFSNVHTKFSSLKLSAFQPYSIIASTKKKTIMKSPITENTNQNSINSVQIIENSINLNKLSNPFILNQFENVKELQSTQIMDDNAFGERFDELRRINRRRTIETLTSLTSTVSSFNDLVSNNYKDRYSTASISKFKQPSKSEIFSEKNCSENKNSQITSYLLQQEIFLASKKSKFVKPFYNKTLNGELDLISLEKKFEEDPFGEAPVILPHQQLQKNTCNVDLTNTVKTNSNSIVSTVLMISKNKIVANQK